MKKSILVLFCLLLPTLVNAMEPAYDFTLFFSNDVHGKTEPCG